MFKTAVVGIALVLLGCGCATTSAVRLGAPTQHALTNWKDVRVYREASQVPGHYEEVALLHGTGDWQMSNEGTVYDSMRKKAASLGANAIILEAMKDPGTAAKIVTSLLGVGGAERKGQAIAIYILGPTAPDSASAAERK